MWLGWLWLSILNTTASPSPISMTPAFSPGPWITHGALVGSVRRCSFEDLYEQCSFHIAEKMPSSVKVGVRPMSLRMRSYSSGLRPWAATSAGVIFGPFAPARILGGALVARLGTPVALVATLAPLVAALVVALVATLATGRLILRVGDFLTVLIVLAMTPKWMVRPRRAMHGGDRPQHHARSSR